MKNFVLIVLLFAATGVGVSVAQATNLSSGQTQTSTNSTPKTHKHKIKHYYGTTRRSYRTQMQLRQANKHIKEDKKVQQAQRELKKDTA